MRDSYLFIFIFIKFVWLTKSSVYLWTDPAAEIVTYTEAILVAIDDSNDDE